MPCHFSLGKRGDPSEAWRTFRIADHYGEAPAPNHLAFPSVQLPGFHHNRGFAPRITEHLHIDFCILYTLEIP
jgi:hypothetical protein